MLSFTVGLTISSITSSIALSMMRPTPNHSPLIVSTPARSETPSTTSFVTEPSVPLLSSNYFPLDNVSSSESVRGTSRFLPLRPRRREAWRAFQSGAECGPWEYARRQSSLQPSTAIDSLSRFFSLACAPVSASHARRARGWGKRQRVGGRSAEETMNFPTPSRESLCATILYPLSKKSSPSRYIVVCGAGKAFGGQSIGNHLVEILELRRTIARRRRTNPFSSVCDSSRSLTI